MNYYHYPKNIYHNPYFFSGVPNVGQLFRHYSAINMIYFNIGYFSTLHLKFTT